MGSNAARGQCLSTDPLGQLPLPLLVPLAGLCLGLGAHDAATPLDAWGVVEALLRGVHNLGQFTLVIALHISQRQGGCRLLVHNLAQPGLALQQGGRQAAEERQCNGIGRIAPEVKPKLAKQLEQQRRNGALGTPCSEQPVCRQAGDRAALGQLFNTDARC